MDNQPEDCDIVDYNDDSSEYTLDTSVDEDDEEDGLKELDIDGQCRQGILRTLGRNIIDVRRNSGSAV